MQKQTKSRWVWYAVLAAIVCGLFAPTMVANALAEVEGVRCPIPARGDVL
jgi:hypothetical protein